MKKWSDSKAWKNDLLLEPWNDWCKYAASTPLCFANICWRNQWIVKQPINSQLPFPLSLSLPSSGTASFWVYNSKWFSHFRFCRSVVKEMEHIVRFICMRIIFIYILGWQGREYSLFLWFRPFFFSPLFSVLFQHVHFIVATICHILITCPF